MIREIIHKKFVAVMHILPANDIQKLTLNAVRTSAASPHTKSKKKIDMVKFAPQWFACCLFFHLESEDHRTNFHLK